MAKPKIRFKGYQDDWEQRKLGEVFRERIERATGDEELLSVTIAHGVIRQADSEKRNIASEDKKNYKVVHHGDVPYNSMRMWQGAVGNSEYCGIVSPAYTVLIPTQEANGKFFMELFKKENSLKIFQRWSQGLTSDTWNLKYPVLSTIEFHIPNINEQNKIATYFSHLDLLITLHQRKCDEAKKLKKFMLQKMFPQNESRVPEIRFDGFTDDWEQRKLGEVYAPLTKRNTDLLPYNKILSVATMTYKTDGNGAADSSLANYKRLQIGDIAFEGHTSKEFKYGRFVLNDVGDGIMSPRFSALRPLIQLPMSFWKYYIHYEPIMCKVLVNSTKAGTMMNELVVDEFLRNFILVPSKEEQKCIGDTFVSLDSLITLHQQKCDDLKKLKKYMLQNMFV